MFFKRIAFVLSALAALALVACNSSSGGGGASSTYAISGSVDTGQTSSSLNYNPLSRIPKEMDFTQLARTQCTDGKYYSVYCVSFTTPPVAAEGDVDCSNGGAFSVSGLPLNSPIGCFVRRYDSDTTTVGSNVGAIQIPAQNLNGKTETIVGGGDLTMAVTLGANGTITAEVTGSTGSVDNSTVDAAFTGDNMNGVWTLTCDSENGGSSFSAGHCKCFLGEDSYGAAGYSNQDDCLNDPGGPGASISGTVVLPIGLYIYQATVQTDIPLENSQTLASGSTIKGISIWSASGSGPYTSNKVGGEGVTNLGGALAWATTPLDPTTAVTWKSGNVSVQDGTNTSRTVNIPVLPADPNVMDHTQWMTWIQSVAAAAETGSFACTFGPTDANAHNTQAGTNLDDNIECINQVFESMRDLGESIPRIHVQPFCDNNGCEMSIDAADNANSYYNANALKFARINFEGWHLDYPQAWANTDDYTTAGTDIGPGTGLDAGIGMEPSNRHVFEPLEIHSNGAGFRQSHKDERHYECVSGAAGQNQVSNAACTGGGYFELVCHSSEELAIKFIGTSSPMDVIFDEVNSPVSGRLYRHNGGPATEVTPTGTDVLSMCASVVGGGSSTFMAKGTKQ